METRFLIICFTASRKSAARRHFQDGVESVLRGGGCEIKKFVRHGDGSIRKIVEELVYPESTQAVIIALDAETLLETAQILADSSVYPEHVSGLYGRGTATPLLNYLDRGVISGLSVTDDFSTGYLSVRRAVEILSNQKTEEATVLESYYIRKEDLRSRNSRKCFIPLSRRRFVMKKHRNKKKCDRKIVSAACMALACILLSGCRAGAAPEKKHAIRIGVSLYRQMTPLSAISGRSWKRGQRNMNRRRASR